MPLPITRIALTEQAELLNPKGGRRMDLPGFDDEFVDFPDYIIRITDRIWHERQVELCERYYTDDCEIHTLTGDIVGAQTVTKNTRAMMNAFPDRRLEPDNVIWSDDGADGFYSSHLITSPMTHLGASEFGPATGRKVRVLTIADCLCRDNKIYKEWLVRDTAGLVEQLGLDLETAARAQAQADLAADHSLIEFHATNRMSVSEPQLPVEADHLAIDPEHVVNDIWSPSPSVDAHYFDRARGFYPRNKDLYGRHEISAFIGEVFQAIPDLQVSIRHVCAIPYLDGGQDIAVALSMAGTHAGDGIYGEASNAPIYIMAVCHWRVIHGRIHQEWMVWDDLAVRRQIWTARLAS